MGSAKQALERVMGALPEAEWRNPRIMAHNDEYRVLHTLIATSTADGNLYYYESDTGKFAPLNLKGD